MYNIEYRDGAIQGDVSRLPDATHRRDQPDKNPKYQSNDNSSCDSSKK